MAVLTVNAVSKAGVLDLSAVLVAADVAGDSVGSSGGLLLVLTNGDGSPHTLTVAAPTPTTNCGNLGSLDVDDIVFVVAAGDTGFLTIPLGYVDATGNFAWTYDAVTSVTIGVFSLSP